MDNLDDGIVTAADINKDDSDLSTSPDPNPEDVFTDDSNTSTSPHPNPHDAFSSLDSDEDIPTVAGDVFSSSESDSDIARPLDIYPSSDRDVNLDIFDSDSNNSRHPAANVFTSSDSDSEVSESADVFHSHEGNGLEIHALSSILASQLDLVNTSHGEDTPEDSMAPERIAALPVIPGPFTAQFFSNIPGTWMDPPSDGEYDPSDDDENISDEE